MADDSYIEDLVRAAIANEYTYQPAPRTIRRSTDANKVRARATRYSRFIGEPITKYRAFVSSQKAAQKISAARSNARRKAIINDWLKANDGVVNTALTQIGAPEYSRSNIFTGRGSTRMKFQSGIPPKVRINKYGFKPGELKRRRELFRARMLSGNLGGIYDAQM